jgi:negative regulator of sigma E activity
MDGELDPAEAAALLERVQSDPGLHQQWTWLHVVQDAVRSHEVAAMAVIDCHSRVEVALQAEPKHARRRSDSAFGPLRHYGLQGLALAAGIAAVAWIAVPLLHAPSDAGGVATKAAVRGENLNYYIEAHTDLAGGGLMPPAAALLRASYAEERER